MSTQQPSMCGGGSNVSISVDIEGRMRFGPSFCFQDLVLDPLLLFVLGLFAIVRAKDLYMMPRGSTQLRFGSVLQKVQVLLLGLSVLKSLGILMQAGIPAQTIHGLIELLKSVIILAIIFLEAYKGVQRGAPVKAFWIVDWLFNVVRLRLNLMYLAFSSDIPLRLTIDSVSFGLSFIIMMSGLLLRPIPKKTGGTSFQKMDEGDSEMQPSGADQSNRGEGAASWWSRMVFSWMTPLLVLGKKRQLDHADLSPLIEEDTCDYAGMNLNQEWQKQLTHAHEKEPSLFKALSNTFGWTFTMAGFWKMINDLVVFVGPLMLRSLIGFVEEPGENKGLLDGAILALGIFAAKMTETIALGQYFHIGYRVGGQIRSAITHLVYRKAFMLSSKGRQQYKLGEMVSLMSVDATRLCNMMPYLHQFWSAPVQLVVSVALLYSIVGPSVFAGMLLMVLLIPANTYIAQKQTALNRQIMKIKDERANTMDEILQGIRIIKYFAWEKSFIKKVEEIRGREMALIWLNGVWGVASMFLWGGSPMLVALITFLVYTWSGQELKPSVAFTALALFNVMRFPLNALPMIINYVVEGRTALTRLSNYLMADEVDPKYYANCGDKTSTTCMMRQSDPSKAIIITDARFSWSKPIEAKKDPKAGKAPSKASVVAKLADAFSSKSKSFTAEPAEFQVILRDINLQVLPGELVMVCGPVGSGKSSLLAAILGDMRKDSGEVELHGRVAFVAQQPWIVNATLKDNILFGAPYDEEKYNKVIQVCALTRDLEVLPAGDSTEIGEKGINLSGGQKARVSLARACYQDADVYLLDDPLSAVDVHVSKILFEDCIKGFLAGKTVVLVTHQIQYLPRANRIAVIDSSRIVACGTLDEISATHPHLVTDLGSKGGSDMPVETEDIETIKAAPTPVKKDENKPAKVQQQASSLSAPEKGKTIATEVRNKGEVQLQVWRTYMKAMGWSISAYLIGSYIISQALQLTSDWQLSSWSGAIASYDDKLKEGVDGEVPEPVNTGYYLGMYTLLTILAASSVVGRGCFCLLGTIRSAAILHDSMLNSVIRAPVKFFDTTPTGRVLNRFSTDQYTVDNELRQNIQMLLMCLLRVVFVGYVILYVTPIFIVCIIPLGCVYYYVQKFYRASSREMKRLESVAKSPIFANFSETITGITTIRAFDKQDDFSRTCFELNDSFSRAYICNNSSNRWLAIHLETIGNIAVGFSSLFAVMSASDPSVAGLVGMSITYALEVTGMLNWSIRTFTQMESCMIAVERMDEYSKMEVEAPAIEDKRPPDSWPSQGRLTFDDVWMRYREELEPALRGISFTTEAGEKIGIVGRTGAGKSSLAVALFRMTEVYKGEVRLDGINVRTIGLQDLRSRMSIIPQDPMLFSGTIRSNLDPFNDYSDTDLWDALNKVHLQAYVQGQNNQLKYEVTEGGQNLSVGQRQLMCMARALLRKAKVIVMDEATASVDMQTDAAIQDTIRQHFQNSTVLTIAHRLDTVMACNRVMVLGEGRVLEMGDPKILMADTNSTFHAMTADSHAVAEMLG